MTRHIRAIYGPLTAALLALALSSCSVSPVGVNCTDELRVLLTPRDTSVAIGAAFQARVALSTCGGSRRLGDTFAWSSSAPDVVRVNAATGRVTAVGPGETSINVVGARYGPIGSIQIAVTP